jgi:hypothetical protein
MRVSPVRDPTNEENNQISEGQQLLKTVAMGKVQKNVVTKM